jgi:hypothetical protein
VVQAGRGSRDKAPAMKDEKVSLSQMKCEIAGRQGVEERVGIV